MITAKAWQEVVEKIAPRPEPDATKEFKKTVVEMRAAKVEWKPINEVVKTLYPEYKKRDRHTRWLSDKFNLEKWNEIDFDKE